MTTVMTTGLIFAVQMIFFLFALLVFTLAGLAFFTYFTAKRVEAALPPQGHFVEAGGIRFHVYEQGQGPALLLIHGLVGQMKHYTYGVIERLSDEFRVVVIDRPGSGYSARPPSAPADLSAQAASIAALIDKLQLGKTFVVGHSLGGAIGLTLAVEHPNRVSGLALVAPLTYVRNHEEPPAAFKALAIESPWLRRVVAWTMAVPGSISRSREVLVQVFGPEPVPNDFATRAGGLLALRPSHFIATSEDLLAVPKSLPAVSARYGELKIPVNILYGREDRILNWKENGQAFVDKVAHAELQLVEGGHMLPVTNPDLTARFIREAASRSATGRLADSPVT